MTTTRWLRLQDTCRGAGPASRGPAYGTLRTGFARSGLHLLEADLRADAALRRVDVDAVDEADPVRVRLHHQRRRPDPVAEEPHPFHQRPVGDAGGGKNDVLTRRQVLRAVDALRIRDSHLLAALFVLGLVDHEAGIDFTAEASHGGRGDHTFRRAADTHDRVHPAADHRGGDAGREVTIANQADA